MKIGAEALAAWIGQRLPRCFCVYAAKAGPTAPRFISGSGPEDRRWSGNFSAQVVIQRAVDPDRDDIPDFGDAFGEDEAVDLRRVAI